MRPAVRPLAHRMQGCTAALFVLALLVFLGQIGIMVAAGILVVVLVGAALFSRMKTPSD